MLVWCGCKLMHERGANIASQGSAEFEAAKALLVSQGLGHMLAAQSVVTAAPELVAKDHSFHYLPYDFAQSGLELGLLKELLKSAEFQASGLEVYYNGARHLTDFRIVGSTAFRAFRRPTDIS